LRAVSGSESENEYHGETHHYPHYAHNNVGGLDWPKLCLRFFSAFRCGHPADPEYSFSPRQSSDPQDKREDYQDRAYEPPKDSHVALRLFRSCDIIPAQPQVGYTQREPVGAYEWEGTDISADSMIDFGV